MKIALTAIARHENRYLKEWFDYYRNIGINHIFIGDNNDIDDTENIQNLVDKLGYQDFVNVINKRKDKFTQQGEDVQTNFYKETYNTYGKDYDWMCFFDIDEYLEINPQFYKEKNINYYIENCCRICKIKNNVDPEQIQVGWLIYDDNDKLFYEDKPLQERFTRLSENIYTGVQFKNVMCGKVIVKCGLDDVIFPDMHHSEFTEHTQYTCLDGGFSCYSYVDMANKFLRIDAVIKHYYSKSLEEFIQKRFGDKTSYIDIGEFEDCVNKYFSVNKRTLEKEKLFELYKKLLEK